MRLVVLEPETQHIEQLQFIQNRNLLNPERFPFFCDLIYCISVNMIFMIFSKGDR